MNYSVQYEIPCDDPVNNIRVKRGKKRWVFYLPLNHPAAHNIGLQDLIAAIERKELLTRSTALNNITVLQ